MITRDKRVSYGKYCISGTGIPVTALKDRYKAGDTIEYLMWDYDLTKEQILAAINFRRKSEHSNSN